MQRGGGGAERFGRGDYVTPGCFVATDYDLGNHLSGLIESMSSRDATSTALGSNPK